MSAIRLVKTKPDVLRSLRFSSRQNVPNVLEFFQKKARMRFDVDEKYLRTIESAEAEIPFELLKEFARLYKFPISCFLLPKPLKDDPIPLDFRKVPASESGIISPAGALALRAARRAQYMISMIDAVADETLPIFQVRDGLEKAVFGARELLHKVFAKQEKTSNPYDLFSTLRSELENLGIVVLKLSFPVADARAFSITDQKPYVIVINNKDGTEFGYSPKVFSLLHEFGHILLRAGGLCNDFSSAEIDQEAFCNAFAAECLIPSNILETLLKEKQFEAQRFDNRIQIIDELRKYFLVSGEALIRHIHTIGALSWDEKEKLIADWNIYAVRYRKKSFVPKLTQSQKCVGKNGKYYTRAVFDGVARGLVTPESAMSCLGIRQKYYTELQSVVAKL